MDLKDLWEKNIPGRGTSKCHGSEVGQCPVFSRNSKESSMAERSGLGDGEVGMKLGAYVDKPHWVESCKSLERFWLSL